MSASTMTVEIGVQIWRDAQGRPHRDDGPAKIYPNGDRVWCRNGSRHRDEAPAVERVDGSKEWWVLGARHRIGAPAIDSVGGQEWWVHGKRHRTDGPAVSCPSGYEEWWVDDRRLEPAEVDQRKSDLQALAAGQVAAVSATRARPRA